MGFNLKEILEAIVIYGLNPEDGVINHADFAQDENILIYATSDKNSRKKIYHDARDSFKRYLKTFKELEPLIREIENARNIYYQELNKRKEFEKNLKYYVNLNPSENYAEYLAFLKGLTATGKLSPAKLNALEDFMKKRNINHSDHKKALHQLQISQEDFERMIEVGNGNLDQNLCRVCWIEKRSHVCMECFYLVICSKCSEKHLLKISAYRCPTCRKDAGFSKIFM